MLNNPCTFSSQFSNRFDNYRLTRRKEEDEHGLPIAIYEIYWATLKPSSILFFFVTISNKGFGLLSAYIKKATKLFIFIFFSLILIFSPVCLLKSNFFFKVNYGESKFWKSELFSNVW